MRENKFKVDGKVSKQDFHFEAKLRRKLKARQVELNIFVDSIENVFY